ncbi:uncharacterized protein LOC131690280 [Topomyia yanbarensis]|uniref:uncharacterized protein LOC131690280 n=1 Tax=Topomyia yanbarensis TaxID=2498891 RepID=UPI00273AE8C3|nr:uncharacterized protein LOC131690280 [Topomyia yanbarensis]
MSQIILRQSLLRLHQLQVLRLKPINRCLSTMRAKLQKSVSQQEYDHRTTNEPIKYFGSSAARWKAEHSRSGVANEDMLWYQPYVVIASVAVFLIYFCVLREENDIDRDLEKSLYDHIPKLEEQQLLMNYHYNKEHGISTVEIELRMKELGMDIE